MAADGWVKLWRKLESSDLWSLPDFTLRVWLWVLMNVNRDTRMWRGEAIGPGEMVTSYAHIGESTAHMENNRMVIPSVSAVRWALRELELCQALRHGPRQGGLGIKVLHWEEYQDKKPRATTGATTDPTTGLRQGYDTNPRSKKKEEKKEHMLICTEEAVENPFDTFWSLYPRKVGKVKASEAFDKASGRTDTEEIVVKLKERVPMLQAMGEFTPYPSTWLNQSRWTDEVPSLNGNGHPARVYSAEDEAIIDAAVAVYRQDWEEAQDMCPSDYLWVEVLRRAKTT